MTDLTVALISAFVLISSEALSFFFFSLQFSHQQNDFVSYLISQECFLWYLNNESIKQKSKMTGPTQSCVNFLQFFNTFLILFFTLSGRKRLKDGCIWSIAQSDQWDMWRTQTPVILISNLLYWIFKCLYLHCVSAAPQLYSYKSSV